jgi:D-alanyl-D-alanine carboxypeptidase
MPAVSESIEKALQLIIDPLAGDQGPGAILAVDAPSLGVQWHGAAGFVARGAPESLTPDHSFRIASMSKTITSASTLRLVEQGLLRLEDRLGDLLPPQIVDRVHLQDGVSRGHDITLRQLLTHSAGLWDFAMSREWAGEVRRDPGRFRAPGEILDWALEHSTPVGLPGWGFHYSDTGYVLVGVMLERLTERPLHELCRELVLDPLGMKDTWLEGHEEPRGPELSHTYVGEFDGLQIHGSVDWSAGGHVSTAGDLGRLMRGLFEGKLFARPETADSMLDGVPADERGSYGLGVQVRELEGVRLLGHAGFWGSFMYYLPVQRATITGTVNRVGENRTPLLTDILRALGL